MAINGPQFTDYNAEAEDIARRRKYAEMLQAQSMEALPGTQMAGGWAIPQSPLSGLARMLQAYNARAGMDDATARQRALAERYRTEGNAALAAGLRAYRGAPATSETIMDETANGGEGQMAQIQAPAVAGSPEAAMAAWGSHPQTAGMSQALLTQMLKAQDPYTLAQGAKRIGPNGQVLADNPKPVPGFSLTPGGVRFGPDGKEIARLPEKSPKDEGAWGEPYNLGGAYVQKNSLTGQIRQAVAREPVTHVSVPPPITAVSVQDPNDPNRTIVVDGRTGRLIGAGPKLTQTGSAEQKLSLKMPEARLRVESVVQNLDKLDTAIQELDKDKGLSRITGTVMGRTPNLTNAATGAQAQLNSIKSQIFVSSLQAMREASKTGGAVGNVSDREGDKLERTLAALDQAQGTPDFKRQLAKAREQLAQSKALINAAFEEQYGNVPSRTSAAPTSDGPPPGAVRRLP